MPWHTINGHSYFFRTTRKNGKTKREYFGCGRAAQVADAAYYYIDQLKRLRQEQERRDVDEFRTSEDQLGVAEFAAQIETFARGVLAAAGYRQHNRGQWRKFKMHAEQSTSSLAPLDDQAKLAAMAAEFDRCVPSSVDAIIDMFTSAAKGDAAAAERVRDLLRFDTDGYYARLLGHDVSSRLQWRLVMRAARNDLALRETLMAQTDQIRREAAGPNPSPSEKLLADRVAITWLNLHSLEFMLVESEHKLSGKMIEELSRHIVRANKMYLAALKTLATVRRLALPSLQLNLARNQVVAAPRSRKTKSVAGGASPATEAIEVKA